MVHITHRIGMKAPVEKIYEAISTPNGISNWWTTDAVGQSEIGGSIHLKFLSPSGAELGSMEMKILTLESNKKVQWKCLDGPAEWIGTEISFHLHQEDDYTILLFKHANWQEEVEFKAHCTTKWAIFLMSLKEYVEIGTGKPSPNDTKIDNWN